MGRPRGNGSNTTSNQDSADSSRASQDNGSRGRRNGGRTVESRRRRESRSEDITAQGERGHTVFVLEGQVQETVTQGRNSEYGSAAAPSSNSWDNFVSAPPAAQSTAPLSATLDTSSPGEENSPQRNPLSQAALHRNELPHDDLRTYHQSLWHPTSESELIFSPAEDILTFPFDNYLTESGDGPGVAEASTTESTKRAGHPLYQDINRTLAAPGPVSATHTPPEALQSSYPRSPPTQEQYESCLHQLSELHLKLYRLFISSSENNSQPCPSDHSFSPGSTSLTAANTTGIDEMFAATETLIEILQHLNFGVPEPPQDFRSCNFRSQSPQRGLPIDLIDNRNDEAPFSSPAGSRSSATLSNHQPDTTIVLLILACYLRLLHIYEPLVKYLHRLLQQSTLASATPRPLSTPDSNTSQSLHPYLPAFSLGCFNLVASSDLNIRLLLHLMSQMLERIHKAVRVCVPAGSNNSRPLCVSGMGKDTSRYWEARFGAGNGGEFRSLYSSPMALAAETALSEVGEMEKSLVGMLYAVNTPQI